MSSASALTPLFGHIPDGLRAPLFVAFNSIVRNFRERRWEPAELNGGKLCEVIYSILRGYIDGAFPSKPSKPRNMVDACRALEASGGRFPRSLTIQLPRMLIALYEVRNNRGVGHVGGDVDPNHMDAVVVVSIAKWLVAELIRVFHDVDTGAATAAVETITDRTIPLIWSVGGNHRVLNPALKMKDKMLALLYTFNGPVQEADLTRWVEHSNPSVFRQRILQPAHADKLLEYDSQARTVQISPLGAKYVEDNIRLEL